MQTILCQDGTLPRVAVLRHDGKTSTLLLPTQEPLVTVCAWCLPGEALFETFPHLAGNVRLSHGICREHLNIMRGEILVAEEAA
jgi:hypothetical protein